MIRAIVEGQGEVAALPVLLRRLRDAAQAWGLEVGQPHRRRRSELVKKEMLQRAVQVALMQRDCSGVLILLDADDDCPKELAQQLESWAHEVAGEKTCVVVMANREYEAWFLASIETLRGKAGILPGAAALENPEGPRDAKGKLEEWMAQGFSYSPTLDQAPLTAQLDLALTYGRSRSFRKLVSAFGVLAAAAGHPCSEWPPSSWL